MNRCTLYIRSDSFRSSKKVHFLQCQNSDTMWKLSRYASVLFFDSLSAFAHLPKQSSITVVPLLQMGCLHACNTSPLLMRELESGSVLTMRAGEGGRTHSPYLRLAVVGMGQSMVNIAGMKRNIYKLFPGKKSENDLN